jgi:signal transduction histidine kinase
VRALKASGLRQIPTWVNDLLAVHHPSPTRQIYGRICAVLLVALSIGGALYVAAGLLSGSSPSTLLAVATFTALMVLAWWLNRRGHLAGPVVVVTVATMLTTLVYDPSSYILAGGRPIVHLGFVLPAILAAFFIHPLTGYPVVGATVLLLGARAGAQLVPTSEILVFALVAGVQLSLVATITALVAWAIAAALRAAAASRAMLEQRIAERTALLEAQTSRARRLLDERKSLYSSVAHDLRNDASRLLTLVDQLMEAWRDGDVAESAAHERRLLRFVRRQAAYARDLTDVSLVSEGVRLPMHATLVDLAELAVRLVDDLIPEARSRQVTISVETRPGVGAAWCDPARTERVLRNLVENAIKAVHATGEAGSVTVVLLPESGGMLGCEVVDTGCGIDPEDLRRLGHRFERVRLPGVEGDGLGLGLTLSAQLVALQGGTLHLGSPGRGFGAVAAFTIPAYQLEDADLEGGPALEVGARASALMCPPLSQ